MFEKFKRMSQSLLQDLWLKIYNEDLMMEIEEG